MLLALSACLVWLMSLAGVMDHPGDRSAHTRPTPKGGGVGIVAAFLVGLIWADQSGQAGAAPIALAAAVLGLAAFSFLDDLYDWPFFAKLAAQLLASLLVIAAGYRLGPLPLVGATLAGPAATALTLAWLLVVTNAVNFMDGLDGLVAGCALIASGFAAALAGAPAVAAPTLALAAGLAGFLPFNWPRARIFMGDVGSQPTGFVLAVLGVELPGLPGRQALLLPLLLSPLLLDAMFTVLRRILARQRITQAHRGHFYQVAHRAGLPAAAVAAIYWGLTAFAGLAAWAMLRLPLLLAGITVAAPLVAFALWGAFVAGRAKRAGITSW